MEGISIILLTLVVLLLLLIPMAILISVMTFEDFKRIYKKWRKSKDE